MLIDATKASLLIIDVQERLLPVMSEAERVLDRCSLLLRAAEELDVPITISQQYPKGLGPVVTALESNSASIMDKLAFSVWREEPLQKHFKTLRESGFSHVVVCGIESHVCVLQSAMDLKANGFEVFVVADAVSSRTPQSVDLALTRLRAASIEVVNTEMAVFELAGKAGTPEFKALSAMIK